ncbi:Hypothetical predicted protein [Pelobates cultripes]|uniref:Uncharacterized protein n=1 Tax=Pelobates cultripes TaxID=61616 RepID=A0AAD1W232_PELCU|nr:Hypothetical predicted protein [Pelobates cultripes]
MGEPIQMKPLPGQGFLCFRGLLLSHILDVEDTIKRRNQVDLQVAEQQTIQAYKQPKEELNAPSLAGPCTDGRDNIAVISERYEVT